MFENFVNEVAKPHRKFFIIVVLLLFFLFLIGFALTLLYVNSQNLSFDLATTQKIQNFHNALFLDLMDFVSLFGTLPYLLIPFCVMLFWLLRRGSREEAFFLPIVFVAPIVSEVSKVIVSRPRPEEGLVSIYKNFIGFSFPSGHVLFYTLFFGFVAFLALSLPNVKPIVRPILFAASALMVILVGISRVYLGAHWPTDVIAGYLAGLAILEIMIVLYLKDVYLPKVRKKQQEANYSSKN
jgi:undecaprenyl-diphosphatase